MKTIQLTLKKVKDTKGTFVFGDDNPDAPIPSVYIKKSAFPEGCPQTLKVTLEAGENE